MSESEQKSRTAEKHTCLLAYSATGKTGAATTATGNWRLATCNTKNTSNIHCLTATRKSKGKQRKAIAKAKARTATKAPRIFLNLLYEKQNPRKGPTAHPSATHQKNTTQRHPAVAARKIIRKGKRKRKICYKCATYTAWHGKAGNTMHTKSYAPDWEE